MKGRSIRFSGLSADDDIAAAQVDAMIGAVRDFWCTCEQGLLQHARTTAIYSRECDSPKRVRVYMTPFGVTVAKVMD